MKKAISPPKCEKLTRNNNKREKRCIYLDLAGELRKLWNMRVMVIPFAIVV